MLAEAQGWCRRRASCESLNHTPNAKCVTPSPTREAYHSMPELEDHTRQAPLPLHLRGNRPERGARARPVPAGPLACPLADPPGRGVAMKAQDDLGLVV